ncbi:MAG: bifunctional adenosylcobinamide kinase/adenosylcobinamide-phosphate guanylyltransferase, partial [Anaerolineales bacterium]
MRTLITGGIKSGKSHHALVLAESYPIPRYFLATAQAFDEEMREKIARHKAERNDRFITIEEPIAIHEHLKENMIIDCIPLWLNNMLYYCRESEIETVIGAFIE